MNKILFFFLSFFTFWFLFIKSDAVVLGPGVMAPQAPLQENVTSLKSFSFKDYTITPLAYFEINAKVLSRQNYSYGREADLSPLDLALGWGRMSDEAVLENLSISQSNRWYRWEAEKLPIPRREIEINSANMHMIPRDEDVASALKDVHVGDIVQLRGKLVRVSALDGWHWVSSLSRKDTGGGACELVYLEGIKIERFPKLDD